MAAIAAGNNEVELTGDAIFTEAEVEELLDAIEDKEDVTIDGGGNTITLPVEAEFALEGVTLKNLTLVVGSNATAYTRGTYVPAPGVGKAVIYAGKGTVIENCIFESPYTQYDVIVTAGGVTIEGCKFLTATHESLVNSVGKQYGKRAIYVQSVQEGGAENIDGELTVTGCTFDDKVYAFNFKSTNCKLDVEFTDCKLGGWLSGHGTSHTFENCIFTLSGNYANYVPYCEATFKGCTFIPAFSISLKHASTLTFEDCEKDADGTITSITSPYDLNWDFSGDGSDNGIPEDVTIGESTWKNSGTTAETISWGL